MRKNIGEFVRRGMTAAGFGPIVLVIIYLILQKHGIIQSLTVNEVCKGIVSLFALAFIAGGMNVVYQIERIPLMVAILIHGVVLYGAYLSTYLLNGWLELGTMPIIVFTSIFVIGYLVIWVIISLIVKKKTAHVNEMLLKKQKVNSDKC